MHGDGGHRRAGAGARAADPERRRMPEEHDREQQDEHDGGEHESQPADDRPERSAHAIGAEDRELRGARAGQEATGGVGVLELVRVHPVPAIHHQAAQQHDVRRRPSEADDADARPLARHGRKRRRRWGVSWGSVSVDELAAHANRAGAARW